MIVAVTAGVVFGMAMSFSLGKALGLETRLAFLVAVGNSICGNSAIAAVAPVVKAERREVASAIGLTAVAGVIVGCRLGVSDHVADNARVFDSKLDDEDRRRVDAVTSRGRDLFKLIGDCGPLHTAGGSRPGSCR